MFNADLTKAPLLIMYVQLELDEGLLHCVCNAGYFRTV